jgi:uncharacterized protein
MDSGPRYRSGVQISRDVAGRFLLGRQGLWPGRRWQGLAGTEQAMRTMEHLQLDPLQVVARAQDLALQARVIGYRQDDWARLTYEQRRFFEWGGWLAVRPIDELPFYRVLMRRAAGSDWESWAHGLHGPAVDEMRQVLRDRGEVANRDFRMGDRTRVNSYRSRKDSGVALHYLWRIGEAMVTRRSPSFERIYALAEAVAPAHLLEPASESDADTFHLLKGVRAAGLSKLTGANGTIQREISRGDVHAWRTARLADGDLIEVEIEGINGRYVAVGADAPALDALTAGRMPPGWKPLDPTTTEEVTFLSPLDPAIHDRARTRSIFGFDYKWGVYDKVEKRAFGYYDLPILWGDRLVGRVDTRLDRATKTLVVLGLWLEDDRLATDDRFGEALAAGMRRFLGFLDAEALDATRVTQPAIRMRFAAA